MTEQITAIIFDLGNVLIGWDARLLYNRLLPDAASVDHFLEQISFMEWNAKQDAGRPFRDGVAELSQQFPQYTELIHAYDAHWEESITDPYSETVQIVHELKSAGWEVYLLSNFSTEKFDLIRNKYDFFNLFDDMIISGEHKIVKPDPAIFNLTLQRIKRTASECIFIDDSLPNIRTAIDLGFHTIHFQSPTQLRDDLRKFSIKGI